MVVFSKIILLSLLISLSMASEVSAHLMVAQHGTLNFKSNGIFMVLSLPVSAFENIDDNKDGKMSGVEFNEHRSLISKAVKENILLTNKKNKLNIPLHGLLMSPVIPHEDAKASSDQLVIMGRFPVENIKINDELDFKISLFGKALEEQKIAITATRKVEPEGTLQKYEVEITPKKTTVGLFGK